MANHALVFVHGMGEYDNTWHEGAWAVLRTAYGEYAAFRGTALEDRVTPIPTVYADFFTKLSDQWKSDVAAIKGVLGNELEEGDKSERTRIEKEIDNVANKIGAGADTFAWTHAMDVVLYRFLSLTRQKTNVSLAKQIVEKATTMDFKGWSVVAHSLGTAVLHNTLHALYNTELIPGKPPLKAVETRPKVLAMVANVSRVLQLPGAKVFSTKVAPGSALLERLCETYLNIRHKWDPFTIPQPFLPDPDWPDVPTFHSKRYQHIQPSHLNLKTYMDVHDLEHYLKSPRVHVPIFRGIFGEAMIPDDEFAAACDRFDSGVLDANTNAIRDELDSLLPAGSDNWIMLLRMLFKLVEKGEAP
jgi:hypothetical protein